MTAARRTVLVTGASCEMCKRLVAKIDPRTHRIVGMTRNRSLLKGLPMEVVEGDVRDAAFVRRAASGSDMIIHAAAVTRSHRASDYFEVNTRGTANLVDAVTDERVRFVLISSRTAGPEGGAYAVSKLQAEEYLQARLRNWIIVRPSEIFGGSKLEGIDKLIADVWSKRIIACPVGLSDKLHPIHLDDAVGILHDLIFERWEPRQTYVINGDEGFTYYELVRQLRDRTGRKVWRVPIPRAAMFALARTLARLGLRGAIVPDQIPRLYSAKRTQHLGYPLTRIADYVASSTRGGPGHG